MSRSLPAGVLAALALALPATSQVTALQLDQMATQLLNAGGVTASGRIVVDPHRSSGAAAIRFAGTTSEIYVHPARMQSWTPNTWAFVLGHELGHQVSGRANTPAAESEADVFGARLATSAGYDLASYLRHLISMPESCSPTHGCWHGRARHLARTLGVTIPFPGGHQNHRPARGLPGQRGSDAAGGSPSPTPTPTPPHPQPQRRPCIHPAHAFDVPHLFDWYYGRQIPCQHRAACQHAVHAFDL